MHPRLTTLHMTRTYGGSLEGPPPADAMVRIAREHAIDDFGSYIPLHVFPPVLRTVHDNELLPEWQFMALLNGEPLDEENDGSQLLVIWWSDSPAYDIDGILEASDKIWREHAVDYQW